MVRMAVETENGEPASLSVWRKMQPWGKHLGMNRCAAQDLEILKVLRGGRDDAAHAQVIQN